MILTRVLLKQRYLGLSKGSALPELIVIEGLGSRVQGLGARV